MTRWTLGVWTTGGRVLIVLGMALGLVGVLSGCRAELPEPPETPTICDDCNVVFIVADTLRADHLGAYGYERDTSPYFDSLVERGVLFEQARAQASCTFPSVNSFLTSRQVVEFFDGSIRPGIPPDFRSLPTVFADHGYQTAAVSASPIVRNTPSEHNPVGGFGQGFEQFDEFCQWRESTCVSQRATDVLKSLEPPFFLYLHYMDPHDPYHALPEYRDLFAQPYTGPHEFIANGDPNPLSAMIREGTFEQNIDLDRDVGYLIDRYDQGIRSFDEGLKRMMAVLEDKGLAEKTVFVITSDHGESFYEHGSMKHCFTVYDTEVHVPLWISTPGLPSGRSPATVPLLDIAPTLLDVVGIPAEAEHLGTSLRPLLEDPSLEAHRPTFSSFVAWRAVTEGRYKLLRTLEERGGYQLFDLSQDPGELLDILDDERREFQRLRHLLLDWIASHEGDKTDLEKQQLATEIEEELRSLGYLG